LNEAAIAAAAPDVEPTKRPALPSPSFRERVLDALSEFDLRRSAESEQDPDTVGVDAE